MIIDNQNMEIKVLYPPLSRYSWCMKGIVTQSDCEETNRFLVERRGNLIEQNFLKKKIK